MNNFEKRAYGFVVVKAINSNYNADFSGQPRTLPDGTVYATDKALKFTVRHFIKNEYPDKKVFFYKRFNENQNPYTLAEAYESFFNTELKKNTKQDIIKNLLSAIDVRFFGATFAPKGEGSKDKNISIHGPVQINHGINIWKEGNIYSEQIISPFRDPSQKKNSDNEEKSQSTLGRQSRLQEGHYLHHFSINPKNLEDIVKMGGEGTQNLSEDDIKILKDALRKGATYYDSAAKAGTENEILFYVELKKDSKAVLPVFTDMVKMDIDSDGIRIFDFEKIKEELKKHESEIEKCEIYYNKLKTKIENLPESCQEFDINDTNEPGR